ncbi:hypothetical protein HY214_03460 [Candidatus Roizmanbacteria bacterium]|nr:hypothetical protein [Candidatus Roizmanbacteria bacterium]
MKKLAKLVSLILGPQFVWPLTLLICLFYSGLHGVRLLSAVVVLVILNLVVPFGYIYYAFKKKQISDLDLTRRQERYRPIVVAFLTTVISLLFAYFFTNAFLFKLLLLVLFLLLVNSLITFFWKISLHMGVNVIMALVINLVLGARQPVLYLTFPLIFWSRLVLKKHTVAQLLAAIAVNAAIIFLFTKYLTFK